MHPQNLIENCKSNNRKAQFELYHKYFAFVSGICIRYLRNESYARETTNDAFLKIFTKLELFDETKGSFMAWIKKITVNICLDRLKLKSGDNLKQGLHADVIDQGFVPVNDLDAEYLLKMMQQLPEKQSAIFNLFVIEGYSHDEIGSMLDISPGNSRWYLNDAKQRLKNLLSKTAGHLNGRERTI